jgi:hypothetical protein
MNQTLKNNVTSYVREFSNFTNLKFTPELAFFVFMAELEALPITINDVFLALNSTKFYNLKIFDDVLLFNLTATSPWNNTSTRRYLRFMVIEGGFQGLFQYRSPREYIEGFNDTLIE